MDLRQLSHHFSDRSRRYRGPRRGRPTCSNAKSYATPCLRLIQGLADCAVAVEPKHRGREPPEPTVSLRLWRPRRLRSLGQRSRVVRKAVKIVNDVGTLARVVVAGKCHLGAGYKSFRICNELIEVINRPVATFRLKLF